VISESRRSDLALKTTSEYFEGKVKDLNDLFEVIYKKKLKSKVDFILEIKNMHD